MYIDWLKPCNSTIFKALKNKWSSLTQNMNKLVQYNVWSKCTKLSLLKVLKIKFNVALLHSVVHLVVRLQLKMWQCCNCLNNPVQNLSYSLTKLHLHISSCAEKKTLENLYSCCTDLGGCFKDCLQHYIGHNYTKMT